MGRNTAKTENPDNWARIGIAIDKQCLEQFDRHLARTGVSKGKFLSAIVTEMEDAEIDQVVARYVARHTQIKTVSRLEQKKLKDAIKNMTPEQLQRMIELATSTAGEGA